MHFSRALDADDAAWCARILTAAAVEHQPVSRAEAEALFEINDAATERSDERPFRRPAGQGGRPSRRYRLRPAGAAAHRGAVAGHRHRELGAGARHQGQHRGAGVDRRARCAASAANRTLMAMVATLAGAAALPLRATCRTCSTSGCKRDSDRAFGFSRAAGLFPRRFLFAAGRLRVEADGAAREAGGVEIALACRRAGSSARCAGRWLQAATSSTPDTAFGVAPFGIASVITRPTRSPLGFCARPRILAAVAPTSALLTGSGIDIAGFEVRSDRRHEVHGVAAAEAAVHALALPQHGVGDLRPSNWSAPRSPPT